MIKHDILRVFLDSNVIYSGLLSPEGPAGIILRDFIIGKISVIISQKVLEEVIRTIGDELPDVLDNLKILLTNAPPRVVADPSLRDARTLTAKVSLSDAVILAAAVNAQPDYLITDDYYYLRKVGIEEETGLHIVTPEQFMAVMEKSVKAENPP